LSLLKCGLTAPKIAEIGNFWYKFAQKGIPLTRFLQNLACRRESQVRTLTPNFTVVALKLWAYGPLPHAKFQVYRGNVLPLQGEKPIFGLLSKNNTSIAALHAGLPVTII